MATMPDGCIPAASLSLCAVSLSVPSVSPPSALDADDLLQQQLDELRILQAQFVQLAQTWRPNLSDAETPRPRLTRTCWLAPTLVAFQRDLDGLARQCGVIVQLTQDRLDRTRQGTQRLRARLEQQDPSQKEGFIHGPH